VTAARWRSPELADRLVSSALAHPEARLSLMPLTCQFVFAAAAAETDVDTARSKTMERIRGLAFGQLGRPSAGTLQSFLEMLGDTMPAWSGEIERMRSAAMLAA